MDFEQKTTIRRYVLCAVLFAASFVLFPLLALGPYYFGGGTVALPTWLSNVLFFWPQYLLWPNGIVERTTEMPHFAGVMPLLAAAFWLAAIATYVWCLQRVRMLWVLAGLFPAAAVVAQLCLFALTALGFRPLLDGP
jgi:hypothetical protein